ncbi:MAG: FecR domain-containing protein [Gallionella sp.]
MRTLPKRLIILLILLSVCRIADAAALFGTVDDISGSALVSGQSGDPVPVTVGQKIYEQQTVTSGTDGEVHIVTEDGGIIAIRPNTVFRVDQYQAEGSSLDRIFMSLLKGSVRSITGWIGKHDNAAYRISTPTATIGIRGTDHETTVIDQGDGDKAGTYDTVNTGSTVLKTSRGEVDVTPGKFAFTPRDRSAAPSFLAQRPRFLAFRKLRIEQRIAKRKQFLGARLEQMRETRIRQSREIRGGRARQPIGQNRESRMQRRLEARQRRGEKADAVRTPRQRRMLGRERERPE